MKRTSLSLSILMLGTSLAVSAQDQSGSSSNVGGTSDLEDDGTTVVSSSQAGLTPPYAWTILPPLGLHEPATIDTSYVNYAQRFVPSAVSTAYATTGNYGASGQNLIYFERQPMSDFFFTDAVRAWTPTLETTKFYNTYMPMTLLSYNTAGGKENEQSRLHGIFSGNINSRAQVGAMLDYLYSKGCYDFQAVKDLSWGFSGSYMGDRYEMQAFLNHWNMLQKENGGITNDLYITDPAQLQGGQTSIQPKAIPTNLTGI